MPTFFLFGRPTAAPRREKQIIGRRFDDNISGLDSHHFSGMYARGDDFRPSTEVAAKF